MRSSRYVFLSSFTVLLGGLLFGFETVVISGVEKSMQQLFLLDGFSHGFTVDVALTGTLLGALLAGRPADTFGRKKSLMLIAALYAVSALGSGMSDSWVGFLIYRLIGGLGVGASSVIWPMYIAEITRPSLRGRLVTSLQLNIVSGILLSYYSNYLINILVHDSAWLWMLGMEAIPALAFLCLIFYIPESPRWMVLKGKYNDALIEGVFHRRIVTIR